jgi:hypothetical protein
MSNQGNNDNNQPNLKKYNVNPQIYARMKEKYNAMDETQKKELESSISWFFLTDNIKKKTREGIQARMKKRDMISLVLAAVGIFMQILASYNYIDFNKIQQDSKNIN